MKFIKPNFFNGETFLRDLENNKITVNRFYDNGNNELIIEGNEKNKDKIEEILQNHDGADSLILDLRKSALAKLAKLGLTEEEIAAL